MTVLSEWYLIDDADAEAPGSAGACPCEERQWADEQERQAAVIDELVYRSYRYNRLVSPAVSPERWALLFGAATTVMEERFQEEKGGADHA